MESEPRRKRTSDQGPTHLYRGYPRVTNRNCPAFTYCTIYLTVVYGPIILNKAVCFVHGTVLSEVSIQLNAVISPLSGDVRDDRTARTWFENFAEGPGKHCVETCLFQLLIMLSWM